MITILIIFALTLGLVVSCSKPEGVHALVIEADGVVVGDWRLGSSRDRATSKALKLLEEYGEATAKDQPSPALRLKVDRRPGGHAAIASFRFFRHRDGFSGFEHVEEGVESFILEGGSNIDWDSLER